MSSPVALGPAVESGERQIEVDVPTLIAVSTVAWALVSFLHEVVGHVGAALLLRIPVYATSTVQTWAQPAAGPINRTYLAAPTVLILVTAGLALLALRSRMVTSAASRYFLWLCATISLMQLPANLIAGADWRGFQAGLEPTGLWRAGIVAAAVLMAVVGYVLPLRLWMPDLRENRSLQLKITAIPVAVFIVVQTLAMVPNPFAPRTIGGSIQWNTGRNTGALWLLVAMASTSSLWLALVNLVRRPRSTEPVESIRLTRSMTWLAAGLIVSVIFVAVLGPGLGRAQTVTILPPEEGAAYAAEVDDVVENMLTGLSENDFAMFSRDIERSALAVAESTFPQFYDGSIGVLGAYQSKILDHVEDQPDGRVVIYRAAFEKESDVPVRIFFKLYDPDHLINSIGVGD